MRKIDNLIHHTKTGTNLYLHLYQKSLKPVQNNFLTLHVLVIVKLVLNVDIKDFFFKKSQYPLKI